MSPEHEASHGDILRALGNLEGKLDAMHSSLTQKHQDIAEAFRRLGEVEKRVAQGMIVAVAVGVMAPLLWQSINPQLHFGHQPAEIRR
jgi:hypothetical protein